jgi:hypothetical protein
MEPPFFADTPPLKISREPGPIRVLEILGMFVDTGPFRSSISEFRKTALAQVQKANQIYHPEGHLRTGALQFQYRIATRLKKPGNPRRMHIVRIYGIVKTGLFSKPHARINSHTRIFFSKAKPGAAFVLGE